MALDSFLLALLEDPVDHGELLYVPSENVLYNPRKRVVYEVRDSIAVLLPDAAKPVTAAEHDAQAVTQKMLLPGVLLMAGYGVLIFYPALASFTGSHL